MLLQNLLAGLPHTAVGNTQVDIIGLTFDSRRVKPGILFVAVPGDQVDGHQFIPQAAEQGAAAIVGEWPAETVQGVDIPYIQVPESRAALAHLAAAWHDHPGRKMTVIGVTGTDGKTTT